MKCNNCEDGIERLPFIDHNTLMQATRQCRLCNGTGETDSVEEVCVYPKICATCNLCSAVPESEINASICGYICDIIENWITRDITQHCCDGWEIKEEVK
ncbi:MAG: hypothetical protein PF569_01390 [Candidatus Woesearchaeota archaeon]|jgi:hydroxylamine reductase (hybrid-cluster protein)|nr:hypothetical protein [Candidatus Woesearchaeota archaeon]